VLILKNSKNFVRVYCNFLNFGGNIQKSSQTFGGKIYIYILKKKERKKERKESKYIAESSECHLVTARNKRLQKMHSISH
jgi:hypothetical protein